MPPASLTTSEYGEAKVFEVRLDYEPIADVIVPLRALPAEEGIVEPAQLVFTPDNWTRAQTFTVTGINDDADDGVRTISVVLDNLVSEDPIYAGLDLVDYEIKNYDADVTIDVFNPDKPDESPNLFIFEQADQGDGTFAPQGTQIAIRPSDEVREGETLTIRVSLLNGEGEASLDPTDDVFERDLVFTTDNWQDAQIIDVRSIDDAFAEAADDVQPELHYEIITSDPVYLFATIEPAYLTQVNNDVPGIAVSNFVSVVEGGTGTVTVALNTPPEQGPVTIDFQSQNEADLQILGDSTLTFSAENYSHTLSVQSIDNSIDQASVRTVDVTTSVISADPVYSAESADDVVVQISDNDSSGGGGGGGGPLLEEQREFGLGF